MESKEREIIFKAMEVFMRFGIKSVNMDDISKNLGISKKTLYKYVKDKEDLVKRVVNMHCNMEDEAISEICCKPYNAIEETFEMTRFIYGMLKNVHPSVMFDLEKYHPAIKHDMLENRNQQIYQCISNNLKKGIEEGLYRDDLNVDIISKSYMSMINALMKGETLNSEESMNIAQRYLEIIRYHIRGIASEKGLDFLSEMVIREKERIDLKISLTDL